VQESTSLLLLHNPELQEMQTPLKHQTRCVRAFHNKQFFAVGSIEGRCAIRCVDEKLDEL
jgi:mRNA export factor